MGFLKPTLPPYTAGTWRAADFGERAKMATHSWALQGYGTPLGAYIFYAAKALFYLGGWLYWCCAARLEGHALVALFAVLCVLRYLEIVCWLVVLVLSRQSTGEP